MKKKKKGDFTWCFDILLACKLWFCFEKSSCAEGAFFFFTEGTPSERTLDLVGSRKSIASISHRVGQNPQRGGQSFGSVWMEVEIVESETQRVGGKGVSCNVMKSVHV